MLRHKFLSTRKHTTKKMLAAQLKRLYIPPKGEWMKVTFPTVKGPATDEEIAVLNKLTKGTFESQPAIEKMIQSLFVQQHQFKHLWSSLVSISKPIGLKKSTQNMVSLIQIFETLRYFANRVACLDSKLEGEQLPKLVSVRLEISQSGSRCDSSQWKQGQPCDQENRFRSILIRET